MRSVTILAALLALFLSGCARRGDGPHSPGVTAVIERQADGGWMLEYRFAHAAPAWFLMRSALAQDGKPWRAQSWKVETPGVRLERAGRYDVLTGDGAPLTMVRIRVAPYPDSVQADYTPALVFSDGGIAFFTEHYLLMPLASAADAAKLPADLNGSEIRSVPVHFTMRDPDRDLLLGGKRVRDEASLRLNGPGTYIYSGPARIVDTLAYAGIVDPGLPGWTRAELDTFTPRLFAYYTGRLGKPVTGKPTALVSWGGTEFKGRSLGGSVLQGMVVMNIKGAQVVNPDAALRSRMRWFIGHEAAHFWLGQTIGYARSSEAWITEGAADFMAVRAFKALDPSYDDRTDLQNEIDECITLSATQPLSTAAERNAHRANYTCGAVLLLSVEGAMRKRNAGADGLTWLAGLIAAHRKDGEVTQAQWLTAYETIAGPALAAKVRGFIDNGVADPAAFLADLLNASGVAVRRDGTRVVLM